MGTIDNAEYDRFQDVLATFAKRTGASRQDVFAELQRLTEQIAAMVNRTLDQKTFDELERMGVLQLSDRHAHVQLSAAGAREKCRRIAASRRPTLTRTSMPQPTMAMARAEQQRTALERKTAKYAAKLDRKVTSRDTLAARKASRPK